MLFLWRYSCHCRQNTSLVIQSVKTCFFLVFFIETEKHIFIESCLVVSQIQKFNSCKQDKSMSRSDPPRKKISPLLKNTIALNQYRITCKNCAKLLIVTQLKYA